MCEEESEYNEEPAKKTYTSQPWSTIKKQLTMMFVCKEVRFEENYIDSKTRRTILWSATMAWCIIQWKVLVQNRTSKQHQMLHHTFILNYLQSQAFSLWSLASTGIPIILSGFAMSQRRRIARSVSCKGSDELNEGLAVVASSLCWGQQHCLGERWNQSDGTPLHLYPPLSMHLSPLW